MKQGKLQTSSLPSLRISGARANGQIIYLPDGRTFTVTPVFAGLFFKSNELNMSQSAFPIGWTVVLQTEAGGDDAVDLNAGDESAGDEMVCQSAAVNGGPAATGADRGYTGAVSRPGSVKRRAAQIHSFTRPTLQNDSLFISSISNPSSHDFKPAASPTRQIAMMLWITLYWYFHQPAPSPILVHSTTARHTPDEGKPRGEWFINIKRDGVLRGKNLMPKLERMGLIATMDSAVGTAAVDDVAATGWQRMFVLRRMFWQMPGRAFLFKLEPSKNTASFPTSPVSSRPATPMRNSSSADLHIAATASAAATGTATGPASPVSTSPSFFFALGPFDSTSYLPTYFPPPALQYVITSHIRHPLRPKPPRMGEVFYTRYVPSVGQYLSLRVASLSAQAVPYAGPVGPNPPSPSPSSSSTCFLASPGQPPLSPPLTSLSDTALLQKWLADPRVSRFWGVWVPDFLTSALSSRHSFPAIGLWDGVPFGYFEIYWVKEDILGRHIGADAGDFDRGCHVIVGEQWARGRVQAWLSSLVHWIFCADLRTMGVCIEPRVDNERFIRHLEAGGFTKQREVTFPHKQSWYGCLRRDTWEGPAL